MGVHFSVCGHDSGESCPRRQSFEGAEGWHASELERQRQRQSTIDHPFVLEKRLVLNLTKRGILHNHQIGALAAQLLEMNTPGFVEYSKAVVSNAGTLTKALIAKGHKLAIGGTTNHLVLWDLCPHGPTKST